MNDMQCSTFTLTSHIHTHHVACALTQVIFIQSLRSGEYKCSASRRTQMGRTTITTSLLSLRVNVKCYASQPTGDFLPTTIALLHYDVSFLHTLNQASCHLDTSMSCIVCAVTYSSALLYYTIKIIVQVQVRATTVYRLVVQTPVRSTTAYEQVQCLILYSDISKISSGKLRYTRLG